jgi:hypothetical protein
MNHRAHLTHHLIRVATWEGDQYAPFVVPLAGGDFWIGWETGDQDGDGPGVTYRVLPSE